MKKTLPLIVALLLAACGGGQDDAGMSEGMMADSAQMGAGAAMMADSAKMGGMGEMSGMEMADTSSMGGMMDPDTSGTHN